MDYITEYDRIIQDVTTALKKPIGREIYKIVDRGVPHKPGSLKPGNMGIYTFIFQDTFLKIGIVGPSSNARFLSHHYNPRSAPSTLAGSLLSDPDMAEYGLTEENIGEWIKQNCRRIDIFIDAGISIFARDVIEKAFHYRFEPKYEGFKTQRK